MSVELCFVNSTAFEAEVLLRDPLRNRFESMGRIPFGSERIIDSFLDDRWIIRDARSKRTLRQLVTTSTQPAFQVVRVPTPVRTPAEAASSGVSLRAKKRRNLDSDFAPNEYTYDQSVESPDGPPWKKARISTGAMPRPRSTDSMSFATTGITTEQREKAQAELSRSENSREFVNAKGRGPLVLKRLEPLDVGSVQYVKSSGAGFQTNPVSRQAAEQWFAIRTLSVSPRIFVVPDLLSQWECDFIMQHAKKLLEPSTVVSGSQDGEFMRIEGRNSTTAWLGHSEHKVLSTIYDRVADVFDIPREKFKREYAESMQVCKYGVDGRNSAHFDFMRLHERPDSKVIQAGNNRLATVLFTLQAAESGGSTTFYRAPTPDKATDPLEVKLPKGSAVIFYNMLDNGNFDEHSLHSGDQVTAGWKEIATIWVWDKISLEAG